MRVGNSYYRVVLALQQGRIYHPRGIAGRHYGVNFQRQGQPDRASSLHNFQHILRNDLVCVQLLRRGYNLRRDERADVSLGACNLDKKSARKGKGGGQDQQRIEKGDDNPLRLCSVYNSGILLHS